LIYRSCRPETWLQALLLLQALALLQAAVVAVAQASPLAVVQAQAEVWPQEQVRSSVLPLSWPEALFPAELPAEIQGLFAMKLPMNRHLEPRSPC
jgi:hypothetical protein